jgi:hypothetical protein
MWITDWSINNKGNLVALPGFTSYLRHFHDSSSRWSSVTASWFYSVLSLTALPQSPIPGPSPEFLPIHQPVSWGHTRYNKLVKARLKANVWNKVSGEQNGHKAKAQEVQAELESMQSSLKTSLVPRPMANRATWQARTNTAATRSTWYLPFCMVAVTNPIDGR